MLEGDNPIENPITRSSFKTILANRSVALEQQFTELEQETESLSKLVSTQDKALVKLEQREAELMAYVEDNKKLLMELLRLHGSDVFVAETWNETFEQVKFLLNESPQTCLAEHDVRVIESACDAGMEWVEQSDIPDDVNPALWGIAQVRAVANDILLNANNLRNQAKDGE